MLGGRWPEGGHFSGANASDSASGFSCGGH
jgi:hypothetical protein